MAHEPETSKVGSDACVMANGVKYQLSPELAGLTVSLLWEIFDIVLKYFYKKQRNIFMILNILIFSIFTYLSTFSYATEKVDIGLEIRTRFYQNNGFILSKPALFTDESGYPR